MSPFAAAMAAAQAEIYARLGSAATLRPRAGGDPVSCQVILRRPAGVETLRDAGIVKSGSTVRTPVAQVARLASGDLLDIEGRTWRVEGAPRRPGSGFYWEADVSDQGPVAS